jgi:hypothetical protein
MMTGRRAVRIWTTAIVCGLLIGGYGALRLPAAEKDSAPTTKAVATAVTAEAAATETRVKESIGLLSADAMEGRGVGTAGIDKAAEFIAGEFKKIGLKTDVSGGAPFQKFTMVVDSELGKKNEMTIVGPPGADGAPQRFVLKLGTDYTPMSFGGSGKLDVPLVFAGYGITSKDEKYDDYEGLDVKGKCLIVFRHEPQQGNPHGAFNGTETSQHAPFTRKLSNAYEHGAAAVIFVTNNLEIQNRMNVRRKLWQEAVDSLAEAEAEFKKVKKPSPEATAEHRKKIEDAAQQILDQGKKLEAERDPLLPFKSPLGASDGSRLPAMHARREVITKLLADAKQPDLNALEKQIDETPSPKSFELTGWRIEGEVDVERKEAEVKNIVGVLEGSGPHADETIVIGAHYDHLGYGGEGSFVPNVKEIHNGADDNASGATALIESARLLAAHKEKLGRRIVFIAFTGEERGLIGSARYCKEPLFALDKTVAMLNMDMVGRLTDDKLIIQGGDTAKEFTKLLDTLNTERFHFKLTHNSGGFGPSDHASFYAKKIPVLHFFTGLHNDYHRPSDDADKVNAAGLSRVAQMVSDTALEIAGLPERPTYVEVKASQPAGARGGDRPYFGSAPDFAHSGPGYGISRVSDDSPAQKAGVQGGDVLIKLGDSQVGNLEDFDSALRKYKAGDKVPIVVKRGGKDVKLTVTLGAPR